jgi:3-hydroxyisobutyrate dehydrogenase-like beta-hydroxyacid dehydrogenase
LNVPREVAEQQIRMVSPAADYLMPSLFSRNYDQVMASVESYTAVAESSLQTAAEAGLPTALIKEVLGIYREAEGRGLGKKDGTAILEVLLER